MSSDLITSDSDLVGESATVRGLMKWCCELVCGLVGSMLGSDSDHLLLGAAIGAIVGTVVGLIVHFSPRSDLFLSKSRTYADT